MTWSSPVHSAQSLDSCYLGHDTLAISFCTLNLLVAEGIGLAHSAIALDDTIVRGLFRDQIQGALQCFAPRLNTERFLDSVKLYGI
jgi:hypothetical protein